MAEFVKNFWDKERPKAKKKASGKPVEIEDKVLLQYVQEVALRKIELAFPLSFRKQFKGEVDIIAVPGAPQTLIVRLTHESGKEVGGTVKLSHECIDRNSIADRSTYGNMLAERIITKLQPLYNNGGNWTEGSPGRYMTADATYENVRSQPARKKRKPKPPVCVLCGEVDPMFPDWDDCSHTKKERKG